VKFKDPQTGIVFSQYSAEAEGFTGTQGGFQLGIALPTDLNRDEYLGHIVRITFFIDDGRADKI
jgi:hypothetical protein